MATKTISTFNNVTQAAGAGTALIVSANSLPTIQSIKGYCNGTANTQYFLQFFNATAAPANASVPLLSLQVLGGDGFVFGDKPLGWDSQLLATPGARNSTTALATSLDPTLGLIVCLSTTESTLTIGTGGVTMDIAVEIESEEVPVTGLSVVDSGAGLVSGLTVSATPSIKRLVRFYAYNNAHSPNGWIMLFGYASPANGSTPVQQFAVPVGTGKTFELGDGFFVNQGNPTTYAMGTGIYLLGSSTTQTLTLSGANWNITAWYK